MSGGLTVIVDGGLDDALALAVLLGSDIGITQVIATEGSVGRSVTARATARWLATLGASTPVLLGADRGIGSPYPGGRDPFHGIDAFGGAIATLVGSADPLQRWQDVEGTVLCTGALTVVADALRRHQPVDGIVWMGGAVASGGNMTAAAEFNAWMDPQAADEVLTSGVPVRMVPLDITVDSSGETVRSPPSVAQPRPSVRSREPLTRSSDAMGASYRTMPLPQSPSSNPNSSAGPPGASDVNGPAS